MFTWKRTLRAPSSERFVAQEGTRPIAMVDLHYLASGSAEGTVVLLPRAEGETEDARSGWSEDQIADLLASFDEDQLPSVDAADGGIVFTVVAGTLVGQYEPGSDH